MKTIIEEGAFVTLKVKTTSKGMKEINLPAANIELWYPFNVNFTYRYTDAKGYMYLVKERDYTGPNVYNVDILKRTKQLTELRGTLLHPAVAERNAYIIGKALGLGIPTIEQKDYTLEEVGEGFKRLDRLISVVKDVIQDRYIRNYPETTFPPSIPTEDWDRAVYLGATEVELTALQEFGEMYTMLTLMRKIAEGR